MRKFALYYGVLRSNDELVNLGLGHRSEIQVFKDKCIKAMADPKTAEKYSALVLATDYGLKNRYKLEAPKKSKKKEEK